MFFKKLDSKINLDGMIRKTRNDRNDKRNKELITYYLTPHSLNETGNKFKISSQRVHQILCDYQIKRHKINYQLIVQENKEFA